MGIPISFLYKREYDDDDGHSDRNKEGIPPDQHRLIFGCVSIIIISYII